MDENLKKRAPPIMDLANNEENGSNVAANGPQENEEEVAEKVNNSDGRNLTSWLGLSDGGWVNIIIV